MTIKTPVAIVRDLRTARKNKQYEAMIAASQAHLASIPVIPGCIQIYA